jgi:chromosomal replication initiation ATPase DnaA
VNQIALPLDWPVADKDEDFLLGAANKAAFDHLKRWSVWPVPITLLTGPRKSGRSLLGRIFVRKTGGRLFDDAERHDEEALFHAWNEAMERRKPLLIIADDPPPGWDIRLPDLRSRITASPHIQIEEPDDAMVRDLLVKLFADRGAALPPDVTEFVVPRIEQSYHAVIRTVDVLDWASIATNRRLSVALARRALGEAGLIKRARLGN